MASDTQCLQPSQVQEHQRAKKTNKLPEYCPEMKALCYFPILWRGEKKVYPFLRGLLSNPVRNYLIHSLQFLIGAGTALW